MVPRTITVFDATSPITNAKSTAIPTPFAEVAAPRMSVTWVGVSAPIPWIMPTLNDVPLP